MGLGTVGGGTYHLLTTNHKHIKKTQGLDISVKKILERDYTKPRAMGVSKEIVTTSIDDIVENKDISIVCEFIGGIEPARSYILKCLNSGKSVVTANKELIAKHGYELEAAAKANKVGLYYEASCVGGVPIIRTLNESLQGDKITQLMGIFNGTTNFILSKMTDDNASYEDVLKEAQKLGYAEANPSADVEGFDTMYKLSILASMAFNTCIPYSCIHREGITQIKPEDISNAKDLGYVIKLLAIGRSEGKKVEVRVHPAFISTEHPLASVKGSFNAVHLVGDYVGNIMLYGRGAGAYPTGSAIVSDVIFAAKQTKHRYSHYVNNGKLADEVRLVSDFKTKYYIKIMARDQAGVLSKVTNILGKAGVSIEKVFQKGDNLEGLVPVVFLTHITSEKAVQKAIAHIRGLTSVKSVDSVIRVVES